MKKQTRLLLFIVFIVILFLGLAEYILRNQTDLKLPNLQTTNSFQPNVVSASPTPVVKVEYVSVDFGNGQKLTGQVYVQNAYQALEKVAKDNKIAVSAKQYKYGVMVTKVGDTANSSNTAWMYAVNGKPGQIAADRYIIYPGDKVDWKFSKF